MKEILEGILSQLSIYDATLIAVSKTKSDADIMRLYALGHRDFGENRVKELEEKYLSLPNDIRWHMIGHLQKNKVKYIIPFVECIHSVDNLDLLDVINRQANKHSKIQKVLLQVKIAEEDTKYGLNNSNLSEVFDHYSSGHFPNISVQGLMGMATFTEDKSQIRTEFQRLKSIQSSALNKHTDSQLQLPELSMGMSGDYEIALLEGSTMVRIGSLLFGSRNHKAR